jgi:hypothetical protein
LDEPMVRLSKQMVDRMLVMKFRAQRHGTQYRVSKNGIDQQFPMLDPENRPF